MRALGWRKAAERAERWFVSHRASRRFRYGFAVAICLSAILVTWAVPPLKSQSPSTLMLTAIVVTALYAGLGPGLLATAISLAIIDFYFIPPHPRLLPTAVADLARLTVFLLLAVLVSSLADKRRRAEEELRRKEEHFRLLIESTSDIVTILGREGVVLYQSPSFERDLGYEPNELVGQNVFGFIYGDDLPLVTAKFQSGVNKPGATSPAIELRFRAKDGSFRTMECVAKNLLHEPWVAGIVVHSRDITARKELQREQAARI